MTYIKQFKRIKDEGLSGLKVGIPFSSPRLNDKIPGIQKEMIYLTLGNSGAGKTKFVNEQFVFNTFDDWYRSGNRIPLKIHYFSLEISTEQIVASLVIRWLYNEHQILITVPYLLGYIKDKRLAPMYNELIESQELEDYIKAFQKVALIMDTTLNTVSFNIYLNDLVGREGVSTFTEKELDDGNTINLFKDYEENDVRQMNIIIVDHIGLVKHISGQTERQMMQDMGDIMIKFRNRYKFTFSITQQANRNSNSSDRHKLEDLLLKDSDAKGGAGIFDASNVVLGLFSPMRERQSSFMKYKVTGNATTPGLGNRMIALNIIKNRNGEANYVFPMLFLGEIGLYEDLVKPEDVDYRLISSIKPHY